MQKMMQKRTDETRRPSEVVIVLLDAFADWETALLAPALRSGIAIGPELRPGRWEVKYLTPDGAPVRSLGGLRVVPDYDASAWPEACAGLILTGGMGWQSPEAGRIVPLVAEARRRGLPVGAICNATLFLAAHGFLNDVRHTGNTVGMMKAWGGDRYTGEALYEERQAVSDGGIVTANGSAAPEFTRACLLALGADTPEYIERFYRLHKEGFCKA